ncbi:MAG: hypothetical protein NVSMB28_21230 [Collimonas sp.]
MIITADVLALLPWIVLLVVFLCMACLQWRVINALDQALKRTVEVVRQPPPLPTAPVVDVRPAAVPPANPRPTPLTPPTTGVKGPFDAAPSWFRWALHEIGFHEIGNNQGIERYINLGHCGAVGDPWCAIFANAALESSGVRGTRSASSQSFRNSPDFVALNGPALGAIAVYWRGSPNSGLGHVGFYRGENDAAIWTLGGNENDMVQIEALPKSSASFGLIGYYWPKSLPTPVTGPILMPSGAPTHMTKPPVGDTAAVQPTLPLQQTNIVATMFGGQKSAYGPPIDDNGLGVALPMRFEGVRPKVQVTSKKNGKTIVCDIVDVGPWNIHDPYWQTGSRPQAESGVDLSGRKTNRAGIDLTLAAAQALQIDGKGLVDWSFVDTQSQSSPTVT